MKQTTAPSSDRGHHCRPRASREKVDSSLPIRQCIYCGNKTNRVDGFCAVCDREGFKDVYLVTGRDNGWRWHEAWAKSHPNQGKYKDPVTGVSVWRIKNFGRFSNGKTKPELIKSKLRIWLAQV